MAVSIGLCLVTPDSFLTDREVQEKANRAMQHATQVSKNCIATFRGEFFGDPRASPPRAPTDRIVQEPGYALRSALGVTRETQVPSRPCHSLMRVRLKRDLSPVKGLRGGRVPPI